MSWEQGCSLKQDIGYEEYLRKKSMAPFAYTMSFVAPAGCPFGGPRYSECRSFAPGGLEVPRETKLWRGGITRGRSKNERRPQTAFAGTSAFRQGTVDKDTAAECSLQIGLPETDKCRRALMDHVPGSRPDFVNFTPRVEPFVPGGVSTRCNKLVYRCNLSNQFQAAGPVPPAATYQTGVFSPWQ